MQKIKIAFVCVHNSCRSQIAEALAKHLASDVFEAYSGGTVKVNRINQDAVRMMKLLYGIDMEKDQSSKLVETLPNVEIVITMGCNVDCPYLPCQFREDWGLNDPSGQSDEIFIETIRQIETKLKDLQLRIEKGIISLN